MEAVDRRRGRLIVYLGSAPVNVAQGELAKGVNEEGLSAGRGNLADNIFAPAGQRKSLENVIEETRLSSRWASYYRGFSDPYLHLTPEQYRALAEQNGFHVERIHTEDKAWDFQSRLAFVAFGSVTFVEWTQFLPEPERLAFVSDVLDRYRTVAADRPGDENTLKFYQMDITLSAA